jgi:hypothetical protein
LYSSVTVACKILTLKLSTNQLSRF